MVNCDRCCLKVLNTCHCLRIKSSQVCVCVCSYSGNISSFFVRILKHHDQQDYSAAQSYLAACIILETLWIPRIFYRSLTEFYRASNECILKVKRFGNHLQHTIKHHVYTCIQCTFTLRHCMVYKFESFSLSYWYKEGCSSRIPIICWMGSQIGLAMWQSKEI